jgi:hypothetical protein
MKQAPLLLAGLFLLLATGAPPSTQKSPPAPPPQPVQPAHPELHRSLETMQSFVVDMQGIRGQSASRARQTAGNLWIEVNALKREGHNTRTLEWYVSDLEAQSRRTQADPTATRHILNNIDLELDALRRRQP